MRIIVRAKVRAKIEKIEKVGQQAEFDFSEKKKEPIGESGVKIDVPTYKVWVKEAPVNGRANDAIVRVLAEYFEVAKSHVHIVFGQTSKQKIFEIDS